LLFSARLSLSAMAEM